MLQDFTSGWELFPVVGLEARYELRIDQNGARVRSNEPAKPRDFRVIGLALGLEDGLRRGFRLPQPCIEFAAEGFSALGRINQPFIEEPSEDCT
jgi:hypothetical protein